MTSRLKRMLHPTSFSSRYFCKDDEVVVSSNSKLGEHLFDYMKLNSITRPAVGKGILLVVGASKFCSILL